MNFDIFLQWEETTRDTIDFKTVYVDMADDLIAGLMLSQILYWHLPSSGGDGSKLRVERDGHRWLAKSRTDWWDECRLTPPQVDLALKKLRARGVIVTKVYKFAGAPTTHIRIVKDRFMELWEMIVNVDDYTNLRKPEIKETLNSENNENQLDGTLNSDIHESSKTLDIHDSSISSTETTPHRLPTENTPESGGADAPRAPVELTIAKLRVWADDRAAAKDTPALEAAIAAERAGQDRKGAIQVLERARGVAGFSQDERNAMGRAILKLCFKLESAQFSTLDSNSRSNLSKAVTKWLVQGVAPDGIEQFGEWWYRVHLGHVQDYKHPPKLSDLGRLWGAFEEWRERRRETAGPVVIPGDPSPNGAAPKKSLRDLGIVLPGEAQPEGG